MLWKWSWAKCENEVEWNVVKITFLWILILRKYSRYFVGDQGVRMFWSFYVCVVSVFEEAGWSRDFTDNCGSTSLSGRKKLVVWLVKSSGRWVDQCRVDVISHYTLMKTLKKRSEQLRMCLDHKVLWSFLTDCYGHFKTLSCVITKDRSKIYVFILCLLH